DWKAFSTSAEATPRAARPETIHNARLVLGFKVSLLFDAPQRLPAAQAQRDDFRDERRCGHSVGHPDVELVGLHVASALTQWVRRSRSRMIARTREGSADRVHPERECHEEHAPKHRH